MSILLQNAVLWPFLALVAAPILIHFFARARPPSYRFSSIDFIRRIVRTTQRIKRPQDWLLLVLRTLLFILIILLFLCPLFFGDRGLLPMAEGRSVVLLVDASASMGYTEGSQSRFATACAEAAEMVTSLSSRDRLNLIWLRSPPRAVFPELGVNRDFIRDQLRRARVSSEPCDAEEGLRMAVEMLADAEGRREICVVSDFQATNWTSLEGQIPSGIHLVTIKVGKSEGENVAITRLRVEPAWPLAGESVSIYCDIHNFTGQPQQSTVFLRAGEYSEQQQVRLTPWTRTTAAFTLTPGGPGEHPVLVSTSEDSFAGDNERRTLVVVRPHLNIGLFAGDPDTASYWRRATESISWANVQPLTDASWESDLPHDVLLLAGWDGSHADAVQAFMDRGKAVVWSPAPGTPLALLNKLTGQDEGDPEGVMQWEQTETPHTLRIRADDDPTMLIFARGEHGDPTRSSFLSRLHFRLNPAGSAQVVLAYEDGIPALVRYTSPGKLAIWNLPLGPEHSSLAAQPEYLPLLGELILSMRPETHGTAADREYMPGDMLTRTLTQAALASDLDLRNETGEVFTLSREERNGSTYFLSERVTKPGLFTWRLGEHLLGHSVVNFPSEESDLRAMEPGAMKKAGWALVPTGRQLQALHEGRNLWPLLLALALLTVVLEGIVTVWGAKR